jgi:cytidyltransferase-like protein
MENIFRLIDISNNKDLQRKINSRKIGFFPGKFNPPHMGHFLTIMKLAKKYNIIVGITEDRPINSFPKEIILDLLNQLKEYGIEIVEIKGRLIDKKDIFDLPYFDILLSGNPDVIDWAKKMKVDYKFVKRSGEVTASQLRNET